MSRKILGLDIRNDAVSAVLLINSMKGNSIEAHEHAFISNQNGLEDGIEACLNNITEKMDISGSTCIASYPAEKISYRNIRLPFKEQKKITQILPYELEPTLPFPVEDLIIDFYTLTRDGLNDHTDLIAAAVEIPELKAYLQILSRFNLIPKVLTVGGYAT
ncbi:hypothetical protein ACFL0M_03145, partial [Thermodesulfobacteriota bacterium]